jgi:tetratricopeptide (TPR) repeat protein
MYRLVSQMQEVSGGDALSGAMLARAATAMHTDTRRQASHAHNSDYAIDELAGDLWWRKGYASTALIKYQEALKDANERKFPNELERDEALSHIYTELARFSNRVNAHTDVIVYEQAAVALGDTSEEEYICYGYYNLKHFTEAVHSCTTAMNRKENWYALFWRGMAYAELGQIDLAVQDIAKVSESTSSFHSRAVDELILLYLNHDHHRQAIDIYAQHPELFDEKQQSRATLAQNFNNRCYAYMELGELQKALDDCNRSIGFGGLPDTFIKQQELRRRLNQ